MEELKKKIREIPDFPKPGILFYDVTTLLKDPQGLREVVDILADRYSGQGIEKVLGIESRGFILGPALGGLLGELGPRAPFFAAPALSLLNFTYGYFVLPETLDQVVVSAPGAPSSVAVPLIVSESVAAPGNDGVAMY